MSTSGHHASPETGHKRRNLLMIGAIVVALLVFGRRLRDRPRQRRAGERVTVARAESDDDPRTLPEAQLEPERDAERVTQRERVRDPEPDGRATR